MKKMIYICLAAMLALGLTVAASAAGESASVSVSGDADSTLVVVVTVSGCEDVVACDVGWDFDTSVFTVIDADSGYLISGTEGDDGLSFATPTSINGKLARLTLKVKSGAAPGKYTVGCTVSVTPTGGGETGFSGQSAQFCVHDYGEVVDQKYLVSEATCTSAATYSMSCRGCGKVSANTFTVGEPGSHTFDQKVEDEAYLDPDHAGDCQTKQEFYYSCVCGEKGEQTFKSQVKFGEHVYDNACDTECNVCGWPQEAQHELAEDWFSNSTEHWHKCLICDEKLDVAAHEPGPAAADGQDQVCKICDYILDSGSGEHIHQYDGDWRMDDEYHWYQCDCGHTAELSGHEWDRGTVLQAATETDSGLIEYACEVCGKSRVETIAPLGDEDDTSPTQPQTTVVEEDGGTNVLAIVLGVLLIISLCGNAILTYFLVVSHDNRKRR